MRPFLFVVALSGALTFALVLSRFGESSEASDGPASRRERQSAASARDLYQKALSDFARGDEDKGIDKLTTARRIFDLAVEADPTDIELFVERCQAKRLLFEKTPDTREYPAVDLAFKWFVQRQQRAGSWSLEDKPVAETGGAGVADKASTTATATALLVFLGGGKTHQEGPIRPEVELGLTYLISQAKILDNGIDLRGDDGDVLTQALATMVMCEVYEATDDYRYQGPAQGSVELLESLQNQETGGWSRDVAGEEDMATTAWCVMALQSAARARLAVSSNTTSLVEDFLDRMQTEDGAYYGATAAGKEANATAAGLLCRVLLGWDNKHATLLKGVEYLTSDGVIGDDLEAGFFAKQVIFHVGGEVWKSWNSVTRKKLVATQDKTGEDAGSWLFAKYANEDRRGRHWHTGLSCLTLEVYYRYLAVWKNPMHDGLVEIHGAAANRKGTE